MQQQQLQLQSSRTSNGHTATHLAQVTAPSHCTPGYITGNTTGQVLAQVRVQVRVWMMAEGPELPGAVMAV